MTQSTLSLQESLICEEAREVAEATSALINCDNDENRSHLLKELADLTYVCYQMAAALNWDLQVALNRVHKSNLSKLDENGEPIFRTDGKVMKGPNYQPPYLTDLV